MPLIKLPKMDEEEIKKELENNDICRIAFIDNIFPYISPFQYLLINDSLYFHFTDYGKKKKILNKNNNVCVSIENFKDDLSEYLFISIQGKLIKIENGEKRALIIKKMIQRAKNKYSVNFLSVHGFDKNKGWEDFESDKSIIIYKLKEEKERIGLKSII